MFILRKNIFIILFTLVLAVNVWLLYTSPWSVRTRVQAAVKTPETSVYASTMRVDMIADSLPPEGNIYITLVNSRSPRDESVVTHVYFRLSYLLYPRRIYISDIDTVINDSAAVFKKRFTPGEAWLKKFGISTELLLLFDDYGRSGWEVRMLPKGSG